MIIPYELIDLYVNTKPRAMQQMREESISLIEVWLGIGNRLIKSGEYFCGGIHHSLGHNANR